jgi:UMF1 family MFS transporter
MNNKKVQRAWAMYDWANSAYNLVITSTIFPAYYVAVTSNINQGNVSFLGFNIPNSSFLEYAIALSYLLVALFSPLLSSVADVKGNKKFFMKLFTLIGVLACMSLFFFTPGNTYWGVLCSSLGVIGYCGSIVFYNSLLPDIASMDQQDALSAKGFIYGYIGSVILQLICFAFVFYPFVDDTLGARISFVMVGLWWLVFGFYSINKMPKSPLNNVGGELQNGIYAGYRTLKIVISEIKQQPILKTYLIAFFLYSMGVQTVMLAATIFGSKEVKKNVDGTYVNMDASDLIPAILVIQLVAILGAWIIAQLVARFSNFKVLAFFVMMWIAICIAAYFTSYKGEFYILAFFVGLIMGGIQSVSRSTFSKLIPKDSLNTTSYFSFYDVAEKMSIVLGMFSFALLEHIFDSMRFSIISLIIYFVLSLCVLIRLIMLKKINSKL